LVISIESEGRRPERMPRQARSTSDVFINHCPHAAIGVPRR
jgi:hypothetical protein